MCSMACFNEKFDYNRFDIYRFDIVVRRQIAKFWTIKELMWKTWPSSLQREGSTLKTLKSVIANTYERFLKAACAKRVTTRSFTFQRRGHVLHMHARQSVQFRNCRITKSRNLREKKLGLWLLTYSFKWSTDFEMGYRNSNVAKNLGALHIGWVAFLLQLRLD